jgi:GxxExxY protein
MREGQASALQLNEVSRRIVDSAIQVHKTLGPGLLESIYRECLVHEMRKRGLRVEVEVCVPIVYDGVMLRNPLRLDLLVEGEIIIESRLKISSPCIGLSCSRICDYPESA